MPIDFYYMPASATCRAIQMTAKAIGIELNLKLTDLMNGDQLKPEFIKVRNDQYKTLFFFRLYNISLYI